jgi:hypothetical protein
MCDSIKDCPDYLSQTGRLSSLYRKISRTCEARLNPIREKPCYISHAVSIVSSKKLVLSTHSDLEGALFGIDRCKDVRWRAFIRNTILAGFQYGGRGCLTKSSQAKRMNCRLNPISKQFVLARLVMQNFLNSPHSARSTQTKRR